MKIIYRHDPKDNSDACLFKEGDYYDSYQAMLDKCVRPIVTYCFSNTLVFFYIHNSNYYIESCEDTEDGVTEVSLCSKEEFKKYISLVNTELFQLLNDNRLKPSTNPRSV